MTIRLAMWSGPRNISTALMRSFENRADCMVSDEPFYAYYLHRTGIVHPMRDEVIASQPTDWREVVAGLTGNCSARIWYQKHMTLHLLDEVNRDFLGQLTNVFLIRDPIEVAISYHKMWPNPTLADLGFMQQWALYQYVVEVLGQRPVILDSHAIRADPEGTLRGLCTEIGVPFDPAMLVWPAGGRSSDGVWASHWYTQVYQSTSFEAPSSTPTNVPDSLRAVVDAARPYYQQMWDRRARFEPGDPPK